jgi:hypothetical protein
MVKHRRIAKVFLPVLALVVGLSVPGFGGGDEPNPCDYKAFGLDSA